MVPHPGAIEAQPGEPGRITLESRGGSPWGAVELTVGSCGGSLRSRGGSSCSWQNVSLKEKVMLNFNFILTVGTGSTGTIVKF
jgi:hypothetical protein